MAARQLPLPEFARSEFVALMETITLIPAAGCSHRVGQMHLQEVGGLPLVARAARAAKGAGLAGRIVVYCDDPATETIAAAEGAEATRPSAESAGDAGTWDAAASDTLATLQRRRQKLPDLLVAVDCRAPFTSSEDIDGVIGALDRHQADTAFAAVPIPRGVWRTAGPSDDPRHGAPAERQPDGSYWAETGSVYAVRVSGFLEARRCPFGKTAAYEIPPSRALLVESPEDLWRARQIAGDVSISLDRHPVIYVDIDETICITPPDRDYRKAVPIAEHIARVNQWHDQGHKIVYWTARGGWSGKDYTSLTKAQLEAWGARYHSLATGKPSYDLLICDKATNRIPR